jgi:glyceraldehyde-3-phosphate dehydrogenase/erythrose-4-phosphate dehydrogenase
MAAHKPSEDDIMLAGAIFRRHTDRGRYSSRPVPDGHGYTEDPIVSHDIIGDPASCILDSSLTTVENQLIKVFGWYDNEWGYANRTLDLAHLMARTL